MIKIKLFLTLLVLSFSVSFCAVITPPAIVYFKNASGAELLAAKELQRYLYLRTGELPVLKSINKNDLLPAHSILVASAHSIKNFSLENIPLMKDSEEYILRSIAQDRLLIIGESDIATLYGAYKFLESTGIGFALDGDIIPDEKIQNIRLSGFNKIYQPSFSLRGILPFHDFPEGPDWWNEDDYKAIIAQLPKMGMNFIGLHTYPEKIHYTGGSRAEPLVWIGLPDQFNSDGTVKSTYPALHFNTQDTTWGYTPMKTSSFAFGASMIFETDDYGSDYMKNISPWPHSDDENISLFNQVGQLLNHSFSFAKKLGVKTCVGIETPLTIPQNLKAYLQSEGKNEDTDSTVQKIYEGIFSRIKAAYPLDYYWLWTPENWTWKGETDEQVEKTKEDLLNAVIAAKKVNAPFTLATCGWVLGPASNPAEFDQILPKAMPFSCINREVGYAPVERGFKDIKERPKWAIPWVEDDPALTSPQFWAGRIIKDAVDAYQYGCTGLMGIHWRTKILSPAFMALSKAGWNINTYTHQAIADTVRDYPVQQLYLDWTKQQFGGKAAASAAAIFTKLDGFSALKKDSTNFPHNSVWMRGPGAIQTNFKPWKEDQKDFAFIKNFERCRQLISGAGNLERYYYWLNTFYYTQSLAHVSCLLGEIENAIKTLQEEKNNVRQQQLAKHILSLRKEMLDQYGKMMTYLLETISTTGGMGTVTNLEEHNRSTLHLLTKHDSLLSAVLHAPVPRLILPHNYQGQSRVIVTTKRTLLQKNEDLNMKIRVLSAEDVQSAVIYWKPLGANKFESKPLLNAGRKVYAVHLSHSEYNNHSFEYYIEVKLKSVKLKYPVTAPGTNSTVVVW